MIKLVEDSLSKIVAKVVNKNLFSRAFSENSCVDHMVSLLIRTHVGEAADEPA